jgi:hypothetical protein
MRFPDEILDEISPDRIALTCENCTFWISNPTRLPMPSAGRGYCFRFPPTVNGRPITEAPDWCGEHILINEDPDAEVDRV